MKYSLVLEGGGAKGAYQIGAVKALLENGFEFDTITGTSIGAINAAYLAQGKFKEIYQLWKTLSFADLFDLEREQMEQLMNLNFDLDQIKYLSKKLGQFIKEKGMDTTKIRKIMESTLDEKELRRSDIQFGLVTVCLSDMKPQELFLNEIPEGKLIDYLMATSNLPVFQRAKIDEKNYLDGGVWDACPVNMLERRGCQNIIAIRVFKRNRIRGFRDLVKRGNVSIYMIQPMDALPSILNFDSKNLNELLKLGYYDGLRFIKHLEGYRYYFKEVSAKKIEAIVRKIDPQKKLELIKNAKILYVPGENVHEIFETKYLKSLANRTKVKDTENVVEAVIALVEHVALEEGIERYKLYSFSNMIKLVKEKIEEKKERNKKNQLIYDFLRYFPYE